MQLEIEIRKEGKESGRGDIYRNKRRLGRKTALNVGIAFCRLKANVWTAFDQ